jgi:hypothetical protein|tara:strand:- start:1482 stop:1664 length:183 start_codon:yes stop_codon:yes gene_type:complete
MRLVSFFSAQRTDKQLDTQFEEMEDESKLQRLRKSNPDQSNLTEFELQLLEDEENSTDSR